MEAGRMITLLMTSESPSKKADHKGRYQPTLPIPLSPRLAIDGNPQRPGNGIDQRRKMGAIFRADGKASRRRGTKRGALAHCFHHPVLPSPIRI
jgi:hypothetical protein